MGLATLYLSSSYLSLMRIVTLIKCYINNEPDGIHRKSSLEEYPVVLVNSVFIYSVSKVRDYLQSQLFPEVTPTNRQQDISTTSAMQ
jgi:hypothetical protein